MNKEKSLFVIYSSWSRRGCWFLLAESDRDAWKWLEKKIPFARNMLRWSVKRINPDGMLQYLHKDAATESTITEIDRAGTEIAKKKARIIKKS